MRIWVGWLMVLGMASIVAAGEGGWVRFEAFEYRGTESGPAPEEGEYRNPILPGFYPDPGVCRVGEEYYLVNSTFAWWPGVPVFRSRDLVNWEQVGHVLERESQVRLGEIGVSEGVFAPTISHHEGVYYMVTTVVQGGGNMVVTARDPAGPWSDPVWLNGVNGIDPSLFFDEDGKAYLVHNGPPPEGKALYDGHRAIWLHEFDVGKRDVVAGTARIIVNGGTDLARKPIWIEGPHIFKRGGKYYLIAAEGGTGDDHSQVVFRSEAVGGPYAAWEGNPILTQRHLNPKRANPVTCVGHAGFVQTQKGEWWAVFLGCRPYEPKMTNIGRETFLLPVKWTEDGWPVVLRGKEAVGLVAKRPMLPEGKSVVVPQRDEFDGERLSSVWNVLRTPTEQWYEVRDGTLWVKPRAVGLGSKQNPSMVARRQQHATFDATAVVELSGAQDSDAGMVAFQNETHHFFLGLRVRGGKAREAFVECADGKDVKVIGSAVLPDSERIELKISAAGRAYSFAYHARGGEWVTLVDRADGGILSTYKAGGFVGSYVGVYARTP